MQTPKIAGNTFPLSKTAWKRAWLALVAGTLVPVASWAQMSDSTKDDLIYLKQQVFRIPIQIAKDKEGLIRELHLYVSTDRGSNWTKLQTAQPTEKSFTFKSQADGEYWFTLAYVDNNDKVEPADIRQEPAGLKVLVDTTAPVIDIAQKRSDDTMLLRWQIDEAKPKLESLRFEVKAEGDDAWQTLPVQQDVQGEFELTTDPNKLYFVRAVMADKAGNETVTDLESVPSASVAAKARDPRKLDLASSGGNGFEVPSAPPMPTDQVTRAYSETPDVSAPPSPVRTVPVAPQSDPAAVETADARWNPMERPPVAPVPAMQQSHQDSMPAVTQHSAPPRAFDRSKSYSAPTQPAGWSQSRTPANVEEHSGPTHWMAAYASASRIPIASTEDEPIQRTSAVAPEPAPAPTPKPFLSGSSRIEVKYNVRGAGPGGVGKVEMWLTKDNGESWELYADDPDKTSPIIVELPGEGRYGLQVVVSNRAGLGQRPPQAGDAPQMVIEVDTMAPTAEMYQPIPDPRKGESRLWLHWSSKDKHLAEKPVAMYFALEPNGELFEIAKDLPAEGRYSWQVPQDIPYEVYLVMVTKDLAENTSRAVTPNPIPVDLSEPEAEVLNITQLPEENPIR